MNGRQVRVAHITSVHPAQDVRILTRECRTLAEAGYEVTLVAPDAIDQVMFGVTIRGVPSSEGRLSRMFGTTRLVHQTALEYQPQVCHFHDPELIPIALLLKARGKRVVYDAHEDLFADIISSKAYLPSLLRRPIALAAGVFERLASVFFDAVVVANPTNAHRFPSRKTFTVQNYPRADELLPDDSISYADRLPLAVYVGGISSIRGIHEMIAAIGMVPIELNARLAVAGEFTPPELARDIRRLAGADRVDVLGWLDRERTRRLLARARLGLAVLHPTRAYLEVLPTKVFEYMSAGIPVIASNFPLWSELVEGNSCGLVVDPTDPSAISRCIEYLLTHPAEAEEMGRRGRQAVLDRYNWEAEGRKLVDMYETRLATRGGRLRR